MAQLSNIFLNEKLEAKLLDSNLSNCKPNETKGLQTIKNDVFDFGVVLLQVLTGKKSKSVVEEVCSKSQIWSICDEIM